MESGIHVHQVPDNVPNMAVSATIVDKPNREREAREAEKKKAK